MARNRRLRRVHFRTMSDLSPAAIKEARKRLGYSQRQLGEMLDPKVAWRTVASWEAGKFKPKSPKREQLMAILGLGPEVRIEQVGTVGMARHEVVEALLRLRAEIDGLLERL